MEIWAAFLKNSSGDVGVALAPGCSLQVERVEFSPYTGEIGILFSGDKKPRPMGYLPKDFDGVAIRAWEVMIGHFETMQDFADAKACREYNAPLYIV